jgi:hypothetical protein
MPRMFSARHCSQAKGQAVSGEMLVYLSYIFEWMEAF